MLTWWRSIAGTSVQKPDYLATIDVDPKSSTYSQVIHRLPMPYVGDELHHFGWNACSSCHGDASSPLPGHARPAIEPDLHRRYGRSSRAETAQSDRAGRDREAKTNLSAPHTVHCLADGRIMISMLGDAEGNAPGGFLMLDDKFDIAGRWEHRSPRA